MRKILKLIRNFFFPPAGSSIWIRVFPFALLGFVTLLIGYGSVEAWTYTNSPEFCGMACHTMPPEYNAYLRSPHARVRCVECHIGRDAFTTQFTRKAGDLRHVVLNITKNYEYPIHTRAMRPARESCETCHYPEKFSDDSLREIQHFADEDAKEIERIFLIMKTGGGSQREDLGRGIHWHIENEVWYLPTDELEQAIPYVRAIDADGNISEYYDIASDVTPDDVAGTTLERMDCITCHNRVTHTIPTPTEAVDQALSKNLLDRNLPEIREQAIKRLQESYPDEQSAQAAFASLTTFYAENYPVETAEQKTAVQQASSILGDIYNQIVFPDQKLDWETHADNLGHKNTPGCFRCHDGKHLTGTEEAIRLECNLCHAIPVVSDNRTLVTEIELVRGPEPPGHTHSSWITLHGGAIDSSCAACHVPDDPEMDYTQLTGKPPLDGSFCGNPACHGEEWQYSGFDSPALEPVLARQLYILEHTSPYLLEGVPRTYEGVFAAMFNGRCLFCHAGQEAEAGLDLSSYASLMVGGENGPVILPGDPANSLLIQRQSESREHFGQVLDDELEALKAWIAAGAPEN
ncbi:MAG: NapC/NirT family cytochrome c [Anaerolineales bacterium]|nr:NapC/NirT family cytochrome c [Anaerolineales bacterium]